MTPTMSLRLACLALLLFTFGSCQPSVNVRLPSTSVLVEGEKYTRGFIVCFATSTPTLVLKLYRIIDSQVNRQIVRDGDDGRFGVVDNSFAGSITATLSSAKVSDRGVYECVAEDNGMTDEKNFSIYVDVPPSASKISVTSTASKGIVAQGTPFSINCSADRSISPVPVIDLIHQGNIIGNITEYQFIYNVLSATNVDEGNYTCRVTNRQDNATKSLSNLIDVQVPANVETFTSVTNPLQNKTIEIEEGTDDRLNCIASGDPTLTVKIVHGNRVLNESSVRKSISATLQSVKVGEDDGSFACSASNNIQTETSNLTVIVYRKARVMFFTNTTKCIEKETPATLECNADGDPAPDVTILDPDGINLETNTTKATYSFTASLDGTYTCNAKNKYNSENRTFNLRVAREPDAPMGVQVGDGASGAGELKFAWKTLVHYCDTDFPVIRYRLLCRGGGSTAVNVIVSAPFTNQSVPESSFDSGVHYNCSVSAENTIGNSSQSNPFLLREPSGSPGMPTAVTKARSAVVSWTAIPAGDRHGVIRNYTIDVSCISAHCPASQPPLSLSSTSLQRNIDGLSPNTEYRVQVSGHNVIGEGPQSPPFNFKTKPAKPTGSPQSLAIPQQLIHPTNFTAMWQDILPDERNDAITSYTVYVECETASSNCLNQMKSVPLLSTAITNLSPFTTYNVAVSGSNAGGEGPRSSSVSVTTAQGVPGPVRNLMATPFNTTAVNVSWTEPSALNGQFQRYDVTYLPNGKTLSTTTTSIVVGDLVDKNYTFEVRVMTGGGTSQPDSVDERPVFSATVSVIEDSISLGFNSKKEIWCDFRSYPFRGEAKLMKFDEDLTSSAKLSNRTEVPPHTQRLTYAASEVGSYTCAFAGPAKSAVIEVTAPAEILSSTQSPVTLNESSISIFVEARQYPDVPEISCADLTGEVSTLEYPDGANYRRATFTVSTAQTVECSIVGTDKTVSIIIKDGVSIEAETGGPIFGLPDWYDYLVIGIIGLFGLLLLILLLFACCCCCCHDKLPFCCLKCYDACCCSSYEKTDGHTTVELKTTKMRRISSHGGPQVYGHQGVATDEFGGYDDVAFGPGGQGPTTFKPGSRKSSKLNEYDTVAADIAAGGGGGVEDAGGYETIGKHSKPITKAVAMAAAQQHAASPSVGSEGEEAGGPGMPSQAWNPPDTSLVIGNDQSYSLVDMSKKKRPSKGGDEYAQVDKARKKSSTARRDPEFDDPAYAIAATTGGDHGKSSSSLRKQSKSRGAAAVADDDGQAYAQVDMSRKSRSRKAQQQDLEYAAIDHSQRNGAGDVRRSDIATEYSSIRPPSGVLQDEL